MAANYGKKNPKCEVWFHYHYTAHNIQGIVLEFYTRGDRFYIEMDPWYRSF